MEKMEKLKEAVELSIGAGYQLDKEAFDFLSAISTTEDPKILVNRAIQKIQNLKEKTPFIDRSLLETLLKPVNEEDIEYKTGDSIRPQTEFSLTEGKQIFHPYAKEVESNLNIIQDPTNQLDSRGTIEDYLQYFQDRFKRIEKLLRRRIDVKSASSIIDTFRAPTNSKLKIIVMITEKRESKKGISLYVEDLHSKATVFLPRSAPRILLKKVAMLLRDQVVCIFIKKTRSNLLIVEDVIFPDIAKDKQNKAEIPVHAVLTSDIHIGSTEFTREAFNRFILWLNGKHGNKKMRELASHVKYVLIAGDIVDGVGIYPSQIDELLVKDIYKQYKLAGNFLEQIPDYIEVVIIPGNHDTPRKALPQPAISNEFLEPLQESRKVYSLGNPSYISIHNVETLLHHGRSLEDVMATVPGMKHNRPEKAMTLLLQSRHLAPVYGAKTLFSPENRDFLVIENTPDIFHSGHIHKLGYNRYRGVLVVNSGCWQGQTKYMRRHGFEPTPGLVPVVNLNTFELATISFV